MFYCCSILVFLLCALVANAVPVSRSVSILTSSEISTWTAPAQFASAAYCSISSILAWDCGSACGSSTKPLSIAAGGDGGSIPHFYISVTSPTTMVIAIAGTNVSNLASIGIDLDFPLVGVSDAYFPSSNGVMVHQGFYITFASIQALADGWIKTEVAGGVNKILVTGHSLGGALAHLMATHLQRLLGSKVAVSLRAFASPRVGNQAWANYVDATLGRNAMHMINFDDDVPHLPPRLWGFQQSSNEVWIKADRSYQSCTGQEDPLCSDQLGEGLDEIFLVASFIDDFDVPTHRGPYAGVTISADTCRG